MDFASEALQAAGPLVLGMSSEPPPLYKPELLEPKKKLTLLQHCYKEPWIPFGAARPGRLFGGL